MTDRNNGMMYPSSSKTYYRTTTPTGYTPNFNPIGGLYNGYVTREHLSWRENAVHVETKYSTNFNCYVSNQGSSASGTGSRKHEWYVTVTGPIPSWNAICASERSANFRVWTWVDINYTEVTKDPQIIVQPLEMPFLPRVVQNQFEYSVITDKLYNLNQAFGQIENYDYAKSYKLNGNLNKASNPTTQFDEHLYNVRTQIDPEIYTKYPLFTDTIHWKENDYFDATNFFISNKDHRLIIKSPYTQASYSGRFIVEVRVEWLEPRE